MLGAVEGADILHPFLVLALGSNNSGERRQYCGARGARVSLDQEGEEIERRQRLVQVHVYRVWVRCYCSRGGPVCVQQ